MKQNANCIFATMQNNQEKICFIKNELFYLIFVSSVHVCVHIINNILMANSLKSVVDHASLFEHLFNSKAPLCTYSKNIQHYSKSLTLNKKTETSYPVKYFSAWHYMEKLYLL